MVSAFAGAVGITFAFGCGTSSTTGVADGGDENDLVVGTMEAGDRSADADIAAGDAADGALDGASADAGAAIDSGSVDAALTACGDASCLPGQLCEYLTGGPAAQCSPLDDAGGCSPPLLYMQSCPSLGGHAGCYSNAPPAPLRCLDVPASCDSGPNCQCLSPDPCGVSCVCDHVVSGAIYCGCP